MDTCKTRTKQAVWSDYLIRSDRKNIKLRSLDLGWLESMDAAKQREGIHRACSSSLLVNWVFVRSIVYRELLSSERWVLASGGQYVLCAECEHASEARMQKVRQLQSCLGALCLPASALQIARRSFQETNLSFQPTKLQHTSNRIRKQKLNCNYGFCTRWCQPYSTEISITFYFYTFCSYLYIFNS